MIEWIFCKRRQLDFLYMKTIVLTKHHDSMVLRADVQHHAASDTTFFERSCATITAKETSIVTPHTTTKQMNPVLF